MHKEYTFYFCNWLQFLLNFYIMKKIFAISAIFLVLIACFCAFQVNKSAERRSLNENTETVLMEIPKGSSPGKSFPDFTRKGDLERRTGLQGLVQNEPALPQGRLVRGPRPPDAR